MSPRLLDNAAIAAELEAARQARQPITPPAEFAALSIHDAYAVQDALATLRESTGARRSGWKLGLTSSVKQRIMGIDHPLVGRLFADGALASGSHVAHAGFIAPRAEPELAIGLAAPLDADADDATLPRAIAWIAPALEITDSRYRAGTRSAVELIADNTSAAAYVLGERVTISAGPNDANNKAPALDTIATELLRNGAVLASGVTADVLGHPLVGLRFLAKHLAQHGLQTRVGDILLSGAITDAWPASPGDVFTAHLRGLGCATVAFA